MNEPNVVLVVLDSLSKKRVSCYGYDRETTPQLDALAERATTYEHALANSSWTVPSHASLFTGQHPTEHGVHAGHKRFSVPAERTLAGRLSERGYETMGLSTNPWVATEFDFDRGFDGFEDVKAPLPVDSAHPRQLFNRLDERTATGVGKLRTAAAWLLEGNPLKRAVNTAYFARKNVSHAGADVLNDRVKRWLDRDGDEPFFMFLNYMDVHEPYHPPREYLERFRKETCEHDINWNIGSLGETYSEEELQCLVDYHDASLAYLDDKVGELVDMLEARELAEDTLLVVTADHGKAMGEHGFIGAGTFLYDELVDVPLIVSHPANRGPDSVSGPFGLVDIHDLVLKAAGLDPGHERFDGVIAETAGPAQDPEDVEGVPMAGQRRVDVDGHALVRDLETESVVHCEDLPAGAREDLEAFEVSYLDDRRSVGSSEKEKNISEDVKKQLDQLGYI